MEKFFGDDDEDEAEEEDPVGPTDEEKKEIAARFRAGVDKEREKYQVGGGRWCHLARSYKVDLSIRPHFVG